jgi:hypothetical protein
MAPLRSPDSRWRVLMVIVLPIVGSLLLFLLGATLYSSHQRAWNKASEQMQQRTKNANATFNAQTDESNRAFIQGDITTAEHGEAMATFGREWSNELAAATEELNAAGMPDWLQFISFLFMIGGPLLGLISIIMWFTSGHRLRRDLQLRGYDWIGVSDALWLALVLPRKSWNAPLASDFLQVPGSSQELNSLIAFLKLKDHRHRSE